MPEMLTRATHIVVARVTEVGGSESVSGVPYYRLRTEVDEALRGRVDAALDFALTNCFGTRYDFQVNERYLIFAEPRTFGGKLDVIAPMGYKQGVFSLSEDGEATGLRGVVKIKELRERLSP